MRGWLVRAFTMATRGRASSVQATHDCTSALKNLANAVARIRKGVKVLGTPKDTLTFREKMVGAPRKLIQAATCTLHTLHRWPRYRWRKCARHRACLIKYQRAWLDCVPSLSLVRSGALAQESVVESPCTPSSNLLPCQIPSI